MTRQRWRRKRGEHAHRGWGSIGPQSVLAVLNAALAHAIVPGDPAFLRTLARTDGPVASGAVARIWM